VIPSLFAHTRALFGVRGTYPLTSSTSWFMAGNPSGIVAAYAAKGAASYEESKINLSNPGVFDCTDGVAPGWDTTKGWKLTGTEYLNCGIIVNGLSWSFIFKYTNLTSGDLDAGKRFETFCGAGTALDGVILTATWNSTSMVGICYGKQEEVNIGAHLNGVIAFAAQDIYYNGVDLGNFGGVAVPCTNKTITLFNAVAGVSSRNLYAEVSSLAIYSATLTPAQVIAIGNAMP
jgi:hypothetical protein